ncbi:MAG: right-handed parallel beta-helix repeat-containing protein [Actinomycetia bacterium]|nr:right-handed parallel beta-helix repeat-containing protein [Actinomycetes bacterium]
MKRKVEDSINVYVDSPTPYAEITSPSEGEEVAGEVDIEGTAFDMDLASCTLSFKPGGDPQVPGEWSEISSSTEPVWRSTLGSWDTAGLPPGGYMLKLEVADLSGKVSASIVSVNLLHAGPPLAEITSPSGGEVVDSPFQVSGTVTGAGLSSWSLYERELSPDFLCHYDDSTANERDGDEGEPVGSPSFSPGKFSSGIMIGASDGIAYPTRGNISGDSGTLELWALPSWSGSSPGVRILFSTEPPGGAMSDFMALLHENGRFIFYVFDSAGRPQGDYLRVDDRDITEGAPFHVCATWNQGDLRLYVNGREGATLPRMTGTGVLSRLGDHLYVGSFSAPGLGARALIDEVSIYPFARERAATFEDAFASWARTFQPHFEQVSSGTSPVVNAILGTVETGALPGEGLEIRLSADFQSGETLTDTVGITVDPPSPRALISRPEEGWLLWGEVEIEGCVSDMDPVTYRILYKPEDHSSPEGWVPVTGALQGPAYHRVLGTWDTSSLLSGTYAIRLEATDSKGKTASFDRLVEVNNDIPTCEVTFPVENGGVPEECRITGSARGPNFSGYKVEYAYGHEPGGNAEWILIGEEHTEEVEEGVLETWDTSHIPEETLLTLRLTVRGIPGMEIVKTVPVYTDHTPPVALITSPSLSAVLTGLVRIEGTASDSHFSGYTLEWSPEGNPDLWHTILQSTDPVREGFLSWWNTEELPDGNYTLRLTATDTAGHRSVACATYQVSNPGGYTIGGIETDPAGSCLEVGDTQRFICVGEDTDGHLHLVSASWQVSGDVGTIGAEGLFTATARGHGFMVASYDSFTCDAPIAVVTKVSSTVLEEDTTWTPEGNPYVLSSWVVVPKGKTLTLEPGTVVKVGSGGFYVEGTLISRAGENEPPITFTSLKDDSALGDTNVDRISDLPRPGDWSTIYFAPGSSSAIEGTHVLYGGKNTSEEIIGSRHVRSDASIYSIIHHGDVEIRSSRIAMSATSGIKALGSNLTVEECTLDGNYMMAVQAMGGSTTTLRQNDITDSIYGAGLVMFESVSIEGNRFSDLQCGLYISCGDIGTPTGVSVKNNSFRDCAAGLWIVAASVPGDIEISENTFDSCAWLGQATMVIEETNASTLIHHNTLTCPGQDGIHGILVSPGTSDTRVYENTVSGYQLGIAAGSYGDLSVSDNNLSYQGSDSPSYGITLINNLEFDIPIIGENASCSNNTVSGFTSGVFVNYDAEHYFTNTRVTSNEITGPEAHYSWGILGRYDGSAGYRDARLHLESNRISGCVLGVDIRDFNRVTVVYHDYTMAPNPDGFAIGLRVEHPGGSGNLPGESLNLSGNTVEGPGYSIWGRNYTDTDFKQNTITCEPAEEMGFAAWLAGPSGSTEGEECTVEANTVSGKLAGLIIEDFNTATISGNNLAGSNSSGIGLYLEDTDAQVRNNDISGFSCGISVYDSTPFTVVSANKVDDNSSYGLYCGGPWYIDATQNNWGHPSGPHPYGFCNAVGGYADVQPWVGQKEWYGRKDGHDPHCPKRAEPVNVNTGNFYYTHTDLNFEGTGPHIDITRTYNAIDCETDGPLGYGWSYSYSARLVDYAFEDGDMMLINAEGDYHRYINNGDGTYSPEDEDHSILRHDPATPETPWIMEHKDGSWEGFDTSGLIVQVADENQNCLSISRDAEGKVQAVTDTCGQTATFNYDEDGRIIRITDPAGSEINYTYDVNGNLIEVTDLNGGTAGYTYDEKHRIITVKDPNGAEFVHNTYDELNRVVSQIDGQGNEVSFSYNTVGAHTHTFTDALGNTTTFEDSKKLNQTGEVDPFDKNYSVTYDDDENVTSLTDKRGNTTTNTYDDRGNMLTETDSLGNTTTNTYDDKGNCLTTTDPLENMTERTYDDRGNMLTETDAMGNTTEYTYDEQYGHLLTVKDPLGNITRNVYDERGNLVQVINPDGGVTSNVYDSANRKISTTDPEGNTTAFVYDDIGLPVSVTDPEGNTTTYSYDNDGHQIAETNPLGDTWHTTYDEMGRVSSNSDPLGGTTSCEYDANGRKTKDMDPLGNNIIHVYDELGREIETKDQRGSSTFKTYDEDGLVESETDAEGNTTTYTHDPGGRVLTETDPLGNITTHAYDVAGRKIATTDPLGNTTTNEYDEAGRLVREIDPLDNATTYSFDANGNKVSETDPEGNTSLFTYNEMGLLISETNPEGRIVSHTYNKNGARTSTTDGEGNTTTFTYDGLGLLKSVTDPLECTIIYEYDEAGRRISMTDPKGAVTTYSYDECGRQVTETNPLGETTAYTYDPSGRVKTKTDGEGITSYTYDECGNAVGVDYPGGLSETADYDRNNRPTEQSGAGITISFGYDSAGRMESASNGTATTTFTFDAAGNATEKTLAYPGGEKSSSYTYDMRNMMTEATAASGTTNYTYSPRGALKEKTYPNSIETQYSYDSSGAVTSLEIDKGEEVLRTYQVERDNRRNIVSITEDYADVTTYQYDSSSRLIHEDSPFTGEIAYAYDQAGNRLTRQKTGEPQITCTYNTADQLTSDSEGNTYTYNTRGDLTTVENGTFLEEYTWDGKGRLTSVSDTEGLSVSYTYDPLDRTYATAENGQAVMHIYCMNSDMEKAILDETLSPEAVFLSGADGLISSTTDEGTFYYSYNPHADASLITDQSGETTSSLHYDAWGNVAEETEEPYTYLGKHQRRDSQSTGLIKMGKRFYDPETGRFISRDPLGGYDEAPISRNLYVYANDDPVNMSDIMGTTPSECILLQINYDLCIGALGPFQNLSVCTGEWIKLQYCLAQAKKKPKPMPPSTTQPPEEPVCTNISEERIYRHQVIIAAMRHVNKTPYDFGGKYRDFGVHKYWKIAQEGPEKGQWIKAIGLDCSGLVEYAFEQVFSELDFPTGTGGQWDMTWPDDYDKGNAKRGDLVFYDTPDGPHQHVAIYLGTGLIIEEPSTGLKCRVIGYKKNYTEHFRRPRIFIR